MVVSLNVNKLDDLILYLGANPQVQDLGMTKLWKLIYFIDADYLREYGSTLTGSEYIKYEHGPVPSRGDKRVKRLKKSDSIDVTSEVYAGYRLNKVTTKSSNAESPFSEGELNVINKVCNKLGAKSAAYLSDLSHEEPAWINAEKMQKISEELMHYGACEDEDGL